MPANYKEINAEKALSDPDSIFYHYKKLNKLRKEFDIITTGDYQLILEDDQALYAYLRNGADEKLLVINNFTGKRPSFSSLMILILTAMMPRFSFPMTPIFPSHLHALK